MKRILALAFLTIANAREPMHFMFETDSNFVYPTCVSITSLLKNSDPFDNINIHIVTTNVSLKEKQLFEKLRTVRRFNLDIVDFDESKISNIELQGNFVSIMYARLYASDIFPNLNRIVHIDSDVIIKESLYDLWKTNLGDNFLAGVPMNTCLEIKNSTIESGLLLLDLKKFRESNITERLTASIIQGQQRTKGKKRFDGSDMIFTDENAIMEVCEERIYPLQLRYSVLHGEVPRVQPTGLLPRSNFIRKYEQPHPIVFHYNGPDKPWRLTREEYEVKYPVYLYDEWKNYEAIFLGNES